MPTKTIALALGTSKSGLSLEAQLVDTQGNNVGSAVTSGFLTYDDGNYVWTGTIPDSFQGAVLFRQVGVSTVLAVDEINPSTTMSELVETGITLRQSLSLILAALAGRVKAIGLNRVEINAADSSSTVRITAEVNGVGERKSVTLNPY